MSFNPQYQIYVNLMDEAKLRLGATHAALLAKASWHPKLLQEFAYLQLRMLCEIIATCCLIAHGDIRRRPNLSKVWHAPDLIKGMEALRSNFYPTGARIFRAGGIIHLDDLDAPQLTKPELISLWNHCGDFLHRGPAKRIIAQSAKANMVDISPILAQLIKIKNLLGQHYIMSADEKTKLIIDLGGEGENVELGVAERDDQ